MTADPLTDKAAAEAFTKEHQHRPLHFHPPFNPDFRFHSTGKRQCFASGPYEGWGRSRCGNSEKVTLADGSGWCGTHAPAARAKRAAAAEVRRLAEDRKWAERSARLKAEAARNTAFPLMLAALRAIRDGDNDPRATARAALEKFEAEGGQ